MNDDEKIEKRMISSLYLIDKTGISRATLNNYIRMNMLPRPVVKKPIETAIRARSLGYFPHSVLDIIEQIKILKKNGYSMDGIKGKMKLSDLSPPRAALLMPETSPSNRNGSKLSFRSQVIPDVRQPIPALLFFSVLVADLQNAARICTELPPEAYFELINQTWACVESSFKKHFGTLGTYRKHRGEGMLYYFLKDRDNQYVANAISCALEIRESMKKLSMEWKTNKGWCHELYLNIGIDEGQEYCGAIPSAPNIAFTALGDSVFYAEQLSDFARDGAVWTTKNLINKLSGGEKAVIRYGIRHLESEHETVVENSFSRIMDVRGQHSDKANKYNDIKTLAVTEIFGKH